MALTDGIVSSFKFEGNSNDFFGVGTASDTSMSYGTTYGKINQGASFNGSSSYISLGINNSAYKLTSWSVSAWIYLGASLTNSFIFQSMDTPVANYYGWFVRVNTNKLQLSVANNTSPTNYTGATTLSSSTWYNAIFTYDGGTNAYVIYLNGVSDASGTGAGFSYLSSNRNSIGALTSSRTGALNFWNGYLDEINVWNRVLTATEAKRIYNTGLGMPLHMMNGAY